MESLLDPPSSDRRETGRESVDLPDFEMDVISSPKIGLHMINEQTEIPPLEFMESFALAEVLQDASKDSTAKRRVRIKKKKKIRTIIMRPFLNDSATNIVVNRLRRLVKEHQNMKETTDTAKPTTN